MIFIIFFFLFHIIYAESNRDTFIIEKSTNNFGITVKEEAEDSETENTTTEENITDDKKKQNIEWIFIHGTNSGMHTYANTPRPSWQGLWNYIKEQLYYNENYYESIYDRTNAKTQEQHKGLGKLFEENKLPLIMGKYFGYYKIDQSSKNIENHITEIANREILIPFQKKAEKYSRNNTYWMFNWSGDLNNINRKIAARILAEEISTIKTKEDKIFICHSHGGNVILESVVNLLQNNQKINIQYIILMGTPIGKSTRENIAILNQHGIPIINIYSDKDYIQTKDITMDYKNWPKKEIPEDKNNINVEIKIATAEQKVYSPSHEEFYLKLKNKKNNFLQHIPLIIEILEKIQKTKK